MEYYDKVSCSNALNTKEIAEAATAINEPTINPVPQSRIGVGQSWKISSAADMPELFGSGGWQDGSTAFIMTSRNDQTEDALTLSGMGERMIDINEHEYNISNTNNEFVWSQFKNGLDLWEPRFEVGGSQLSAGDYGVRVNVYSNAYDETMQALGDIVNPTYKLDGASPADMSTDRRVNVNPFAMEAVAKKQTGDGGGQGYGEEPPTPFEDDLSYYYNDGFFETGAQDAVNRNFNTGLRRQNIKNQQSKLLERQSQGKQIMDAVNSAQQSYADVLKTHFKDAYLDKDKRQEALDRFRTPTSKYLSSQVGVADASRDLEKSYRKTKKSRPTKLNSQLIGS